MKHYKGVDHIFYLPDDSKENARKFIDAINPVMVLWVKYEYWYYYLVELNRRNIPVILVSGIFRSNQPFFRWYGAIWRKMLACFTCFFVQNDLSGRLLESLGIKKNVFISGDTRFDRVIAIAGNFEPVPFIGAFCNGQKVIVAGSTWEEDENELLHYIKIHPEIRFIIVPHEVDTANMIRLKKNFPDAVFYSSLTDQEILLHKDLHVMIIDNIGLLSRLYKYATIAYVGGGFGNDGVHNVLEAAVYGIPVLFGPEYEKFAEAVDLLDSGGGMSFSLPLGLEKILDNLFRNESALKKMGKAAQEFVNSRNGATKKIIEYIHENRLLIS